MKNQRGVTLIALVVTIIVLIILAGVAIAALTGENGIIKKARESKKEQIEGEVRDLVVLAMFNAKLAAENQATKYTTVGGYKADAHIGTDDVVYEALSEDLSSRGFTITPNTTNKTYELSYTSVPYQQACNNTEANSKILVDLKVSGNSISIDTTKENSVNGWIYGTYAA